MILWPSERQAATPPSGISTEEWGRQNRELSALTSAHAGPWSMDMIPFFRPVLAALDNDAIEITTIQKATQIAGSETVLTWLGKIAAEDPGPAMICFADEDTAVEFCKRRIQPMFRSSPVLSNLIIESEFGQGSIVLKNGFSLIMVWASSIAKTASRPIRYLILDEICKPAYEKVQAEGSVISRIIQRTETFPNKKIVMLSSVTEEGDNMDQQMALCDEIYEWCPKCPKCGVVQPMRFSRQEVEIDGIKTLSGFVKFNSDLPPKEAAEAARYVCCKCEAEWTTVEKNAAVAAGESRAKSGNKKKIVRAGFFIPRTLSFFPGGRLESLTEAFMLAKDKPHELQSFTNNALAEHWKHVIKSAEEVPIASRKWDLPAKVCPAETLALTAAFDMQKRGFWFSVWAHYYQEISLHSAMIWDGEIETFDQVEDLVFSKIFETQDGRKKKIWRAGLDTGGGKSYDEEGWSRTAEAYDFLRRSGRETIFGTKGESKQRDTVVWWSVVDKMPGRSGRAIPGGIMLYHIDTKKLKDLFFSRAAQGDDGKSPLHFHADTSEAYFRQLLSEEKVRSRSTGKFEWQQIGQRANHQLDTAVITMALIDDAWKGGIYLLAKLLARAKTERQQATPAARQQQESPYSTGNFSDNPYLGG